MPAEVFFGPVDTPYPPQYYGRNGYARCVGLEFWLHRDRGILQIWPLNSRRQAGSCMLEVPFADLPALIRALSSLEV